MTLALSHGFRRLIRLALRMLCTVEKQKRLTLEKSLDQSLFESDECLILDGQISQNISGVQGQNLGKLPPLILKDLD